MNPRDLLKCPMNDLPPDRQCRAKAGDKMTAAEKAALIDYMRLNRFEVSANEAASMFGTSNEVVMRELRKAGCLGEYKRTQSQRDVQFAELVDRKYIKFWVERGMAPPPVSNTILYAV
jgi:hypothetical protein